MSILRLGLTLLVVLTAALLSIANAQPLAAIFDDFEYAQSPAEGTISSLVADRDLFGPNVWFTGPNPNDQMEVRAWRRFNWGDNPVQHHIGPIEHGVRLRVDGQVQLAALADRPFPVVTSSFVLGNGTYYSRVRLSSVPAPEMMLAFWLFSQGATQIGGTRYGSEVDFEWNRWGGRLNEEMSISNIRTYPINPGVGSTNYLTLDCGAWVMRDSSQGDNYAMPKCAPGYYTPIWSDLPSRYLSIADEWIDLVFTVEKGVRTSFYLNSYGDISYWGGYDDPNDSVPGWNLEGFPIVNHPEISGDFAPVHDLGVVFGIHNTDDFSETSLSHDATLDIDFFYYTPEILLKSDNTIDVEYLHDQVQMLRAEYRPRANANGLGLRVNTTGLSLDLGRHVSDPILKPWITMVRPPQQSGSGTTYSWVLGQEPSGNIRYVYADVWRYRTRVVGSADWPDWVYPKTDVATVHIPRCSPITEIHLQGKLKVDASWNTSESELRDEYYITSVDQGELCPILQSLESSASVLLPTEYALHPPSPNPSTDYVTIRYDLPEGRDVEISVYDVAGRRVGIGFDHWVGAGHHTLDISASDLASGVYFIHMRAGAFSHTRSFTVTR